MNERKILAILYTSSLVRNLIIGKNQIRDLLYATLVLHDGICIPLRETENKIGERIFFLKRKIKNLIESLDGYDKNVHASIDYVSLADIFDGIIDISIDNDDKFYLDLSNGKISEATEVPEDKRSR